MSASPAPKSKFRVPTAAPVCATLELGDAAKAAVTPQIDPFAYVEALTGLKAYPDAVKFLASALPKREAVWWACTCLRIVVPEPAGPMLAALNAAEAWVYKPGEDTRIKCYKAADTVGTEGMAAGFHWAAKAAFWSGGSMNPPDLPPAPPPESLTPKAVAGALIMIAAGDPPKTDQRYAAFLRAALDIARGGTGRPPA